jgi:hypothetical protein
MGRQFHAAVNIVQNYLDNQHMASNDPAERFQMNVTSEEFRELVETVA